MKLNLKERLLMLSIMPEKGNIVTLRVLKELKLKVGLSSDEIEEFEITSQSNGMIHYSSEKTKDKLFDIEISSAEKGIINQELKKLNDSKELTLEHESLYEKFVESL